MWALQAIKDNWATLGNESCTWISEYRLCIVQFELIDLLAKRRKEMIKKKEKAKKSWTNLPVSPCKRPKYKTEKLKDQFEEGES